MADARNAHDAIAAADAFSDDGENVGSSPRIIGRDEIIDFQRRPIHLQDEAPDAAK